MKPAARRRRWKKLQARRHATNGVYGHSGRRYPRPQPNGEQVEFELPNWMARSSQYIRSGVYLHFYPDPSNPTHAGLTGMPLIPLNGIDHPRAVMFLARVGLTPDRFRKILNPI